MGALPFKPNKYVRWFADAMQESRDCYAVANLNPEDDLKNVQAANEAWSEANDLYLRQFEKICEEVDEVRELVNLDAVERDEADALNFMGECADVIQATMQLMYMVGTLHGISTKDVLGMTALKCLSRDRDFYNVGDARVRYDEFGN